jgi:hypothetical protein
VVQMVEALRYKSEGRGFASRWVHWDFSLTLSFRPHYGYSIDAAPNRNEYYLGGKGGLCLGLTSFLHSCTDCLEILAALTS